MYRIKKGNIERVVNSETTRDIFISKGYKLIETHSEDIMKVGVDNGRTTTTRNKRKGQAKV